MFSIYVGAAPWSCVNIWNWSWTNTQISHDWWGNMTWKGIQMDTSRGFPGESTCIQPELSFFASVFMICFHFVKSPLDQDIWWVKIVHYAHTACLKNCLLLPPYCWLVPEHLQLELPQPPKNEVGINCSSVIIVDFGELRAGAPYGPNLLNAVRIFVIFCKKTQRTQSWILPLEIVSAVQW